MEVKYKIYNPGGNITALVTTKLSKECLHQSKQNNTSSK